MRTGAPIGPWLLPLALAVGCEDRGSQCHQLAERLDPHTEPLARGVDGLARVESDPAVVDRLLEEIDATDGELAVIQLQDERLAGFVLRYRRRLGEVRKAAQSMQQAMRDHDAAGLNAAAQQADAFLEAQAAIVDELDEYCR